MDWTINSCLCGGTHSDVLFFAKDYNFSSTRRACDIRKCSECGALFPQYVPTSATIEQAYVNYYTSAEQPINVSMKSLLLEFLRKRYSWRGVKQNFESVLDYGCGSGRFLVFLRNKHFNGDLFGTDMLEIKNSKNYGFIFLPLEGKELEKRTFRHLTLSHVVEHIHNPAQLFARLSLLTEGGGSVWIATPNADSVLVKAFGQYARDIDFPRHIHVFSQKLLLKMLRTAGFEVELEPAPHINTVLNFVACSKNVILAEDKGYIGKILLLSKALIMLLGYLLSTVVSRRYNAGELVVIATKKNKA